MQYTTEELQTILDLHKKWLCGSEEGKCAYLRYAILIDADLSGADLCGADLRGAYMSGANMRCADMRCADMRNADLSGADLRDANLSGADLSGADLRFAKNVSPLVAARLSIVPETGSFIGYKKACSKVDDHSSHPVIVELEIAADAKRSNATGRKCRCSKAKVISITDGMGEAFVTAYSSYDKSFMYTVGETVEVADLDDNRWEECAPGIHFFITRAEAENY